VKILSLLFASLLTAGSANADEYFRSIDGKGEVHYGDRPQAAANDVEKLKSHADPAPEDGTLPYATRRAQEQFPVTLYVADDCGSGCVRAREYLNKRGIPYTEKNLRTPEEIEAFKQTSGGNLIPALNVGPKWLQKFSEVPWAKELDAAGYPKVAPYGYRPVVKSVDTPPQNE
jgi:glutaredoxin